MPRIEAPSMDTQKPHSHTCELDPSQNCDLAAGRGDCRLGFEAITSVRRREPSSVTRKAALCVTSLLLSVAVLWSAANGGGKSLRVLLLDDADPAAFKVAKARAALAANEVELQNSQERLHAIDALLATQRTSSSSSPSSGLAEKLFKDVKQEPQSSKGLKAALLAKAENYELQADVSAASIASARLKGQKLPSRSEQQHEIDEDDDKMFARVLRAQAAHASGGGRLPESMRLFLQQYRTVDQLRMGRYKEESRLESAREAVKKAEATLEDLSRQPAKTTSKTDEAEEEAMAIERLGAEGKA